MSVASWFYLALLGIGIVLFVLYHKVGKLLKCIFFSAFTGLGALGVVWLAGHVVAVPLAITPLSAVISGILGIPGVVAMLLFHLI